MPYVLIDERGLSGRLGGFGAASTAADRSNAARALMGAKFSELQQEWLAKIDGAINGSLTVLKIFSGPGMNVSSLVQQRLFMQDARRKVQGLFDIVQPIILDQSLSVATVQSRLEEFTRNYGADLDAQIQIAINASNKLSFGGQAQAFKTGLRTVVKNVMETADEAIPDASESPGLYIAGGLAALVAISYIWRGFR
jgi:hypothetical protein